MRTIALTYTPIVHRAIVILSGVVVLAMFFYGFFLLEAVANTAKRASAEHQVSDLTSKVSQLEEQYLRETSDLTVEQAEAMGLEIPKQVTTVFADAPSKALGYVSR
jgi:outer membrane murein-binding lipoprotein Lpp